MVDIGEIKAKLEDSVPSMPTREKGEDRKMEPENFEIGVTTGLPSMDNNIVVEQAVTAMGKGVKYVRIDVESHKHLTPKDKDELRNLADRQGMKWGIHADLTLDLTSSRKEMWEYTHEAIGEYTEMADELDALYVNVHSSVRPSPVLREGVSRAREVHVGPNGNELREVFMESESARRWYAEEQVRGISKDRMVSVLRENVMASADTEEEARQTMEEYAGMDYDTLFEEYVSGVMRDLEGEKHGFDSRANSWTAAMIVAWWMYDNSDSLWKRFCGGKTPEEMLEGDHEDQIDLYDAVSAAYLRGHFEAHLDDMEDMDVLWLIENPDARANGTTGRKLNRLMHPAQILKAVKDIGSPLVRLCIDWEHMATQGYDPWEEAEDFPNDIGKYVVNFDVGSHPNIQHQHHPVERGDVNLYRLLWEVKKRGMEEGYILYEWGGGRDPQERWQMSVPALKDMAKMLEAEVPPDELPKEFFGIGPEEIELERRIMERNMFKHMEGTLEFPELSHGWFGEKAIQERNLETWAKEEYQ